MANRELTGSLRLRRLVAGVVALLFTAAVLIPRPAAAYGVRDAEIEELLREMSDPILVSAGLDPRSVNLYMINDPSLNAFVAGGQNIFFHTGIILEAEVPNELIGVIAHETGHISGGHLARLPEQIAKAQTPMLITLLAGVAAIAAGAPDAGFALLAGSQHLATRTLLAFTRTQESAADQAALRYLEATGQSGRGLVKFFDRFRDQEALSSPNQDPYVRTHPLSSQRIAALTRGIETSRFKDAQDSPEMQRRYDLIKAKIIGFLLPEHLAFNKFPETDQSQPARYARTVAYFRLGHLDKSLAEIDSLIAEDPDNPYFQELKGQVLFETGHAAEALPWYRKAAARKPASALLKLGVGRGILALPDGKVSREQVEEARVLLEGASRLEPEHTFIWHQLAIAYARLGQEPMANLATAERYAAVDNYRKAIGFAQRAAHKLEKGTPAWRRATDIVVYAKAKIAEEPPRPPF